MAGILSIKFGKEMLYFLIIFFLIFTISFLLLTKVLGIPYWWLFRGVRLTAIHASSFNVTITMNRPLVIGDEILISVYDSSGENPVVNATVSLYNDDVHIGDYYTNSSGKVSIEYPGGILGIIINKEGFASYVKSIPETPGEWIRNKFLAGIISAILSFTITFLIIRYRKPTEVYPQSIIR